MIDYLFPEPYVGAPVNHLILACAFILDAVIGDPMALYRRIPHPVAIMGKAIAHLEVALNSPKSRAGSRRFSGVLVVSILVTGSALLGWLIGNMLRHFEFDLVWVVEALLVAILLAFRDLYSCARRVADELDVSIGRGREAVVHIVGRDPKELDISGVARATIESVAENFCDGVVAPVFYYVIFGLPGIFVYKTINTLDSMIGYRNVRYLEFGWAAARLDDLVNLPSSRLGGLLIALAALILPGANGKVAARTILQDASKHSSPNAGWPESAMAGALGLSLAGPRIYRDYHLNDTWIGSGRQNAQSADIRRSLRLYVVSSGLLVTLGVSILSI